MACARVQASRPTWAGVTAGAGRGASRQWVRQLASPVTTSPRYHPGGCRGGASAGQHVQPDGGAPGPGSQLDQVAQLVGDAQAVVAVIVGRVGVASGHRVGDPAVVPDLAYQGHAVSPDLQDS